jgi:hypothetical protein
VIGILIFIKPIYFLLLVKVTVSLGVARILSGRVGVTRQFAYKLTSERPKKPPSEDSLDRFSSE